MKKVDYIIVGDGFGALFFAHQLVKNNKTFVLFSDGEKGASKISAGIVNPVVLKKFTTFDNALEHINVLKNILSEISGYLGKSALVEEPVRRIFHDDKEKATWTKKSQDEKLIPFLVPEFEKLEQVNNPFETGSVQNSFRVDVPEFFKSMFEYLSSNENIRFEKFDYSLLESDSSTYQDLQFDKIVFAEGLGIKNNPFFSELPILPNKGHHLNVSFNDYDLKQTVKKKFFLFPLNETEFYYGGTYDRENLENKIDESSVEKLEIGLKEMVNSNYKIISIEYAFRPTVKDRKPILGRHKTISNFYVFNGLGTRGLLNGSNYSINLYHYIENNTPLPQEVDLERFI